MSRKEWDRVYIRIIHFSHWLREALIKSLWEQIASLRGPRNIAYHIDMSRLLRAVRLALYLPQSFNQRFLRFFGASFISSSCQSFKWNVCLK